MTSPGFASSGTGPFVVKGIVSPDDARRAADLGVDAVSVSNHGGNALDGGPATIRALPDVVEAVDDRIEVFLDGGVRRGGDVVKAVALGARAVLIGRGYVWPLAVAGEEGVTQILKLFRRGISGTLALMACQSIQQVGPRPPDHARLIRYAERAIGQARRLRRCEARRCRRCSLRP